MAHGVEPPPDSNLEPGKTPTSAHRSEGDTSTMETDDQPAYLVPVTIYPKRTQAPRADLPFTCGKDIPLCIGKENRPARDIIEEVCRSVLRMSNFKDNLLELVEAFEATYQGPRAPKGAGGVSERHRQKQFFRKGVVRLLGDFSGTQRGWGDPLERIKNLEKMAEGLR
jgi:hypothetical protein